MSRVRWLEKLPHNGVYTLREAQSSLLQVLLPEFRLSRRGDGCLLEVSFDEDDHAIRRREAKSHVAEQMPGYPDKVERIQEDIDDVIFRGSEKYSHDDPDFAFRYASGGTLPVVQFGDGEEYYCLFYRDIFPVGWNIANGSCDSLPELLSPKRAISRELREELIVLSLDRSPPRDYIFQWPGEPPIEVPEFQDARRLASRFLAGVFEMWTNPEGVPLTLACDSPGPDTLRVSYGNAEAITQSGFFLNINAKDFGVELDRLARLHLEHGAVLLDGEINDNRLLNRPVGLFEVHRTQQAVYNGEREFLPEKIFHSATLEIDRRPQTIKELRRSVIESLFFPYLRKNYIRTLEEIDEWKREADKEEAREEGYKPRFNLCPVTHQIIRRHMKIASPRVFISYSHKDAKYAERLQTELENRGIRVWRDRTHIRRGGFPKEIQRALDDSTHVALIATDNTDGSDDVLKELRRAEEARREGRACIMEEIRGLLPLDASCWPRFDFFRDFDGALEQLIQALRAPR